MPRHLRLFTVSTLILSACAVGPDFKSPEAPQNASYDQETLTPHSETNLQFGQDIPAQWWTLFHSQALDKLIEQALQENPDIQAAEASLRSAAEDTAAAGGALFPTVTANYSSEREKTAGASSGGFAPSIIYTLHNASVNVSYGVDLFGGTRRTIEKYAANEDYSRYQLQAAYLSLTSNLVTAVIQEASLRSQIEITQKIISDEEKRLDLTHQQLAAGGVPKSTVLSQEQSLASVRATLPGLEAQLTTIRHELSALSGHFPNQPVQNIFNLTSLKLPKELPISLPSKFVRQRPDILAAEANLHAATAEIGVREAARLPDITLSADIGSVANKFNQLFTPGGGIWGLGANVGETIFDAGTLAHEQGSAEAQYDVAVAQYKKTVLSAFQDVADTLHALQADTLTLKERVTTQRTAQENLILAHQRFDAGAISLLDLLSTDETEQQAHLSEVQTEAQRYADTAALFQALGGGWWNSDGHFEPSITPEVTENKK